VGSGEWGKQFAIRNSQFAIWERRRRNNLARYLNTSIIVEY
jgi:hypothetical protein